MKVLAEFVKCLIKFDAFEVNKKHLFLNTFSDVL